MEFNNINKNPFEQKYIRNEKFNHCNELKRVIHPETMQNRTDEKIQNVRTLINIPELVERVLRPGDILMSYYPDCLGVEDYIIKGGQLLGEKKDKQSMDYVHVAMYIGDGKFVEAVRESDQIDLKINTLDHKRFKIQNGQTNEFRVFRCKSQEMADEASRLGEIVGSEDKKRGEEVGSYNFKTVVLSPLCAKGFTRKAMTRYLKAAYSAHSNETPATKSGPRNFHCSYLVLWLYQAAESKRVIEKFNKTINFGDQIVFPDLSHYTNMKEKGKALDSWANQMADLHGEELGKLISMNINVKAASPQDTYNFLVSNSNLFEPVLRIVAPKHQYELSSL